MTIFTTSAHSVPQDDVEVLVLFSSPGHDAVTLLGPAVPEQGRILEFLTVLRAKGKSDEVLWLPAPEGIAASAICVVGVGGRPEETLSTESVRRAAGTAGRALAGRSEAALVLPGTDPATVGAVIEGLGYGARVFTAHRSARGEAKSAETAPVAGVRLMGIPDGGEDHAKITESISRAQTLVEEVSWAKDLVDTAPNELCPSAFAERVVARAPEAVQVTVHDAQALVDMGCGGLSGVGQGSSRPPALVRMSYAPDGATTRLAFVGKGVTFDSGGLSLKPGESMVAMKTDMAGAAAVAASVIAIARLGLPVAVDGWLCLAENMPDGNAIRPGDVITMADGTTCEIINTDAEGRLCLADGLAMASREKPDAVVDIATLTGAAIIALGNRTAAVMANDDALRTEVTEVAAACGEQMWPMPIFDDLLDGLKSDVADRKHHGPREGGSLLAAAFLREYVGKRGDETPIPWAHLDIAGPSYHKGSPYGYTRQGGTGFGVRTLVSLAESRS